MTPLSWLLLGTCIAMSVITWIMTHDWEKHSRKDDKKPQ